MIVGVEDNYVSKDNVFRVEWNLGKRCNYDCSYCSPSIHDKKSDHLSFEVIKKNVNKLVSHARKSDKKIRISLTGGEPFIHPEFFSILKYMKENGVDRISVTSNGSPRAETYIDSMKYIDYLVLSLHFEYVKPAKIIEKVEKIKNTLTGNKGLHVHVMAVPSRVKESVEVSNKLSELGVSYALRRVRPQFGADGLFVPPFSSGLLGDHKPDRSKIKDKQLTYYSNEELTTLGVK